MESLFTKLDELRFHKRPRNDHSILLKKISDFQQTKHRLRRKNVTQKGKTSKSHMQATDFERKYFAKE